MPISRLSCLLFSLMVLPLMACRSETPVESDLPVEVALPPLDETAEAYVKLVLAVGQHDADYVDAFYGPSSWREEAKAAVLPLAEIRRRAEELIDTIDTPIEAPPEEILEQRRRFLVRQLEALVARVALLDGETFSFDEESKALYDAVSPRHDEAHFDQVLAQLDDKLRQQGFADGTLIERYEAFRQAFVVPLEKVDEVFQAAIEACRERTEAYVDLPEDESFEVEYVSDKPWSGYNWYQGGYHSLIQVNTDLPIYIDRAIDLACHEGYPGHHVFNSLLEWRLVNQRGWIEYTVYPLFSPQSLIAEGTANYGVELAFPRDSRQQFEEEELFPIAGLDAAKAGSYYEILELMEKLKYADNEAARRYLDGELDADAAVEWLVRHAAFTPQRARQRLAFVDTYRSYVINYNLGEDLVRAYVEKETERRGAEELWVVFAELISTPRLPSSLQ